MSDHQGIHPIFNPHLYRKSKLWRAQSSKSTPSGSTQWRHSLSWASLVLSAPSAVTITGDTQRLARHAVTLSKFNFLYKDGRSCEGTYSFIGNGVGKGKKITYAEAWKGRYLLCLMNSSTLIYLYRLREISHFFSCSM